MGRALDGMIAKGLAQVHGPGAHQDFIANGAGMRFHYLRQWSCVACLGHLRLSDLGVQRLHVHDRLCSSATAGIENMGRSVFELRFPGRDLIGVHVELLRKVRRVCGLTNYPAQPGRIRHRDLERAEFIRRQPRVARIIELLVDPKYLPDLL